VSANEVCNAQVSHALLQAAQQADFHMILKVNEAIQNFESLYALCAQGDSIPKTWSHNKDSLHNTTQHNARPCKYMPPEMGIARWLSPFEPHQASWTWCRVTKPNRQ